MNIIKSPRIIARKNSNEKLKIIEMNRNKTLVIHYSCESFYNLEGRTPRITSICVKNRQSGEAIVFSIHLQAQLEHVDLNTCSLDNIDELEKNMLSEFAGFVNEHRDYYWIHWNMRNATYGFEAISNRARIVEADSFIIADDRKVDLLKILIDLYTSKFIQDKPNGKMLNMAIKNNISTRDALNGKEEADAFDEKNYLKLHMSTMRKVEVIDRILEELEYNTLDVVSKFNDIYGLSIIGIITLIRENPILFTTWSVIVFFIGIFLQNLLG